jgi:hypothetical protein
MSGKDKTTTEPDPTGDIAVTKAVDSDLARRKITKAIESLEKALTSIPAVGRASDVSVSNETAPIAKAVDAEDTTQAEEKPAQKYLAKAKKAINKALANLPDVSRAADASVSNETAPITKDVGDANDVKGDGDHSKPANDTVDTDAKPMTKAESCGPDCVGDNCDKCAAMGITKAACCDDCGDNCAGDVQCCSKCMKMAKADAVPSPAATGTVMASVDELAKAADTDNDGDTDSDTDNDDDDKPVYKSAKDLVDEAKISKSIWGGAFGAPSIPRIQ